MNKSQVIILWVIAIALGAAVAVVKLNQNQASQSATQRAAGQTLFESFPATEASTIEIKGATGTVTLAKKDSKWGILERDNYPANISFVNDFIRSLSELKVTLGMQAGPSFAPRFGMDEAASKAEDRGLTATFKDASGKEIAKVSLGKSIETGAAQSPMGGSNAVGRYVRNHADESSFYAVSEMFPSVSDEAKRWLDSAFINPEKIKSISLSAAGKSDVAWKLSREDEQAEYKLENATGAEVLDTTVTSPLKSLFSYARFDDIVPAASVAERSDTAGKRTATIETLEGFTYTVDITPTKPASESFLVTVDVTATLPTERKKEEGEKPEDAKTKDTAFTDRLKALNEKLTQEKALAGITFEVAKSTVESLLKERDALIVKATPPTADAPAPGAAIESHPGGMIARPRATATSPPIEAVTPPISVPPSDTEAPQKPEEK
ncbi:MAG: DUF4340 domain-containing protein [Luteolibacter sp.]